MPYISLNKKVEDSVAVFEIVDTINHPEELLQFSSELNSFCKEIATDNSVKAAVITGTGNYFLSFGEKFYQEISNYFDQFQKEMYSIAEPVAKINLPVIAAINGDAVGQGLELAMSCDIRIVANQSHFGLPHVKRGLMPYDGGTQRLSRLIGKTKAMEMILMGDTIDADEAYRVGLVSKIVSSEALMKTTLDIAKEMAAKAPMALKYVKEAINKGLDLTLNQGLRLEADLYFLLHTTQDRVEGITAFKEKRAGRFEGK